MMKVKVSFYGRIQEISKLKDTEIQIKRGATVRNLLESLEAKKPGLRLLSQGRILPDLAVLVDGCNIDLLQGLHTKVGSDKPVSIVAVFSKQRGGTSLQPSP